MSPATFALLIAAISFAAGLLGSLVGVGGGIIVVPALVLLFSVKIQTAVAASIVAVVATSTGAAASYVRDRVTNLRLAMVLEIATAAGALTGAIAAAVVSGRFLYLLFGIVLTYTAWSMSRRPAQRTAPLPPDPWADRLKLHGQFHDRASGETIAYRVSRTPLGLAVSYLAGVVSGLLGTGGGVLKVPVMNLAMGLPIKVSTATSNFMIGVTAATGAAVYFMRGDVEPLIAAPVAVGVLFGAKTGARVMVRLRNDVIRGAFVVVLAATAVEMLWKGLR